MIPPRSTVAPEARAAAHSAAARLAADRARSLADAVDALPPIRFHRARALADDAIRLAFEARSHAFAARVAARDAERAMNTARVDAFAAAARSHADAAHEAAERADRAADRKGDA